MDIDELQTVQSRERQTDSLQQLRDSFYSEASDYIQQLRDARDDAAERADDPWDNPEVNRLSDEIKTAEQTVEAIYDRRVGKIVKKASLAAADMPTDEDGLTNEEQALFERLVTSIEDSRDHVLDMVAGEVSPEASPVSDDTSTTDSEPAASPSPDAGTRASESAPEPAPPDPTDISSEPETAKEGVSAADVMNPDGGTTPAETPAETDTQSPGSTTSAPASGASPDSDPESDAGSTTETASTDGVERQTVKITKDVGEILGVDQREYDLSTDDVVTLPEDNAAPLLQRDAAQKLD